MNLEKESSLVEQTKKISPIEGLENVELSSEESFFTVEIEFSKNEIEEMYDIEFTDEMWDDFIDHTQNCYESLKENNMDVVIMNWDYDD